MAPRIRAGAPPGQRGDAQGWRASGVMNIVGRRVFGNNGVAIAMFARWRTFAERIRWHWYRGGAWRQEVLA